VNRDSFVPQTGRAAETLEGERRQRAAEQVQLSAELASATQAHSAERDHMYTLLKEREDAAAVAKGVEGAREADMNQLQADLVAVSETNRPTPTLGNIQSILGNIQSTLGNIQSTFGNIRPLLRTEPLKPTDRHQLTNSQEACHFTLQGGSTFNL
jgi:hypothetical protein